MWLGADASRPNLGLGMDASSPTFGLGVDARVWASTHPNPTWGWAWTNQTQLGCGRGWVPQVRRGRIQAHLNQTQLGCGRGWVPQVRRGRIQTHLRVGRGRHQGQLRVCQRQSSLLPRPKHQVTRGSGLSKGRAAHAPCGARVCPGAMWRLGCRSQPGSLSARYPLSWPAAPPKLMLTIFSSMPNAP
jgi:hypothetical protein